MGSRKTRKEPREKDREQMQKLTKLHNAHTGLKRARDFSLRNREVVDVLQILSVSHRQDAVSGLAFSAEDFRADSATFEAQSWP